MFAAVGTAQVVGRKYIWVAPPSTEGLYPFSGAPPAEGVTSDSDSDSSEGTTAAQQYMSNTSRLDVIAASLDDSPTSTTRQQFPDFYAKALPRAFQAVLEPGDVLLMPVGWWHSLKSLDASCSVSIWF
jgi:hypothetical protein